MSRPTSAAGIAALCGGIAALPYLVVPSGSLGAMILVYLTQLPLFAAGLWLGVEVSVIAGIAGLVILWAGGSLLTAVIFAGLNAFPVVLLVRQALLARTGGSGTIDWYPPGLLSAWLTGLGLAVVAAVVLVLGGVDGIRAALREALAPLDGSFDGNTSVLDPLFDSVAFVLPGLIAASWMVMTASNGSLAQGLLARFGASWRPSPDLAALGLPTWIPVLLAFASGATLLGATARFIGINVLIVLAVPFCLAGLAVLHTVARRLPRPAVTLTVFYLLAGALGWPLLLIALLGLLDSPLGLRRRFA